MRIGISIICGSKKLRTYVCPRLLGGELHHRRWGVKKGKEWQAQVYLQTATPFAFYVPLGHIHRPTTAENTRRFAAHLFGTF